MLDMENDLVFFALDMFGEEKAVLCFALNLENCSKNVSLSIIW